MTRGHIQHQPRPPSSVPSRRTERANGGELATTCTLRSSSTRPHMPPRRARLVSLSLSACRVLVRGGVEQARRGLSDDGDMPRSTPGATLLHSTPLAGGIWHMHMSHRAGHGDGEPPDRAWSTHGAPGEPSNRTYRRLARGLASRKDAYHAVLGRPPRGGGSVPGFSAP